MINKARENIKGFTLIELLVVVAIISLLSSIVFASLNSARGKAREARRKLDMHTLETAIQLYYSDRGVYPPYGDTLWVDGKNWATGVGTLSDALISGKYLSKMPVDPIGATLPVNFATAFYYVAGMDASGTGWGQDGSKAGMSPCTDHEFVWFVMEVPKNPNTDSLPCWSSASVIYARDLGKP